MSLNIVQVRNDLLSKLSIEDASLANSLALQDCVIAINGTLQILQTAGQDFFTQELAAVAFGVGTAFVILPRTVQNVLGTLRWNDTTSLRALSSRGQLDQFDRTYLGLTAFGAALGTPMAYWVENTRDGSSGDINQIFLWLAPRPAQAGFVTYEYVNDSPNYTVADFTAGTAMLPVAQNYTESIFLPIARWWMTRSSQFSRPDLAVQLKEDYDRATATLATFGGFPNAQLPAPPREVEA